MDDTYYVIADRKAFLQDNYLILDQPNTRIWILDALSEVAKLAKLATIPERLTIEDMTVQILKLQTEYANRQTYLKMWR